MYFNVWYTFTLGGNGLALDEEAPVPVALGLISTDRHGINITGAMAR